MEINKLSLTKLISKKNFLIIAAIIALIFAFLFISKYAYKPKADQPPINFSFSPATGTFAPNQQQTTALLFQTTDPANKINGFEITIKAQGNINFISAGLPTAIGGTDTTLFEIEMIKQVSAQTIHLSYVSFKADNLLSDGVQIPFTYQAISEGTGSITIDTTAYAPLSGVVGNVVGNDYSLGTVGQADYTFTLNQPTFSLSPASGNYPAGQRFDVNIMINTGTENTDGADAVIDYDNRYLRAESIQIGSVYPSYKLVPDPSGFDNNFDPANNKGRIQVSGVTNTSTTPTPITTAGGNVIFATVTFTALTAITSTPVSFYFTGAGDRNDSNIVKFGMAQDLLLTPPSGAVYTITAGPTLTPQPTGQPTNTPTPLPTNTPAPTPTNTPIPTNTPVPTIQPTISPSGIRLNLKIKLQGRTWAGASNSTNLELRIVGTSINQTNLTTNFDGLVSGINLDSISTGTYNLLVKPVGHLQRRTSSGHQLNTGINLVDISTDTNKIFLAGDLDWTGDGKGIVNAFDYSLFMSKFKSADSVADYDGSGQVNAIDFSVWLPNWNKTDE